MNKPTVSIIAAIDKNRGIGKDNKIPWHVPEDMQFFKEKTSGHPVIMGRKTFESLSRPLPNRINIVITRDMDYKTAGAEIVHSIKQAIQLAEQYEDKEIFFIGGAQIYRQALPLTDRIYLTQINGYFNCDTFFPDYRGFKKQKLLREGDSGGFTYKILQLGKEKVQ